MQSAVRAPAAAHCAEGLLARNELTFASFACHITKQPECCAYLVLELLQQQLSKMAITCTGSCGMSSSSSNGAGFFAQSGCSPFAACVCLIKALSSSDATTACLAGLTVDSMALAAAEELHDALHAHGITTNALLLVSTAAQA